MSSRRPARRWPTSTTPCAAVGSCAADVVRVHYLLPDADDFEQCWPLLREYFADAMPAATMMVVGLSTPEMRIEIEVTALKPEPVSA